MTKILVTVPTTGWLHKQTVFALLRLQHDPRVHIIIPTHNPYEHNLHRIVGDFLAGDYTHWLSFDDDNPPIQNPLELIELDKDIIGCPTPVWHYDERTAGKKERPVYWNAYDYDVVADAYRPHETMDGLQRVDAIGTGCFLITRRVFEDPRMQCAPFMRVWTKEGYVERGNDLAFCERARACGFEIYAHYGYPAMHINELEIGGVVRAFRNLYE
mgnify:CR=1 FL=1